MVVSQSQGDEEPTYIDEVTVKKLFASDYEAKVSKAHEFLQEQHSNYYTLYRYVHVYLLWLFVV